MKQITVACHFKLKLSCHNAQICLRVGALLRNKLVEIEMPPGQPAVILHVLVEHRHCVCAEVLIVAPIMTRAHTWSASFHLE